MRQNASIDPGLKAWIDHVFVPALPGTAIEVARAERSGRISMTDQIGAIQCCRWPEPTPLGLNIAGSESHEVEDL
jgi:hypothetical protein